MITNSLQKQKNIVWVDVAKFIAMFFVIFEHVVLAFKLQDSSYIGHVRDVIVTFHMPLFFLISGYLYKQKNKFDNYCKILWGLLIPYFIYQFLYLPFKLGFYISYENIPSSIAMIKCFAGILLGDNLGTAGSKYALTVCPALWFVMVMMQLRFLFAHINMTLKNISIVTVISIILLKFLQIFNIDLYFCLDNTLYAIPYFAFGYCLKNYFELEPKLSKHIIPLLVLSVVLLPILSFYYIQFNSLLSLQYACGFVGSFLIILFSLLFKNTNKFVDIIAKNTLFIIFFHSLLLFFTKWLKINDISTLLPYTFENFLLVVFYATFLYIICYFVILLLQKYSFSIILGKYIRKRSI